MKEETKKRNEAESLVKVLTNTSNANKKLEENIIQRKENCEESDKELKISERVENTLLITR